MTFHIRGHDFDTKDIAKIDLSPWIVSFDHGGSRWTMSISDLPEESITFFKENRR